MIDGYYKGIDNKFYTIPTNVYKALYMFGCYMDTGLRRVMDSSLFYQTVNIDIANAEHNRIMLNAKARGIVAHDRILSNDGLIMSSIK